MHICYVFNLVLAPLLMTSRHSDQTYVTLVLLYHLLSLSLSFSPLSLSSCVDQLTLCIHLLTMYPNDQSFYPVISFIVIIIILIIRLCDLYYYQ